MKSILDPSFRYKASYDTDVKKTFERIRRERIAQAEAKKQEPIKLEDRRRGKLTAR